MYADLLVFFLYMVEGQNIIDLTLGRKIPSISAYCTFPPVQVDAVCCIRSLI